MKPVRLLTVLLMAYALNACKNNVKKFNDELLKSIESTHSNWFIAMNKIGSVDSFGARDIDEMLALQKMYEKEITTINKIDIGHYGDGFHKSVLNLYNYALGTCKKYPTIFTQKPSKYTIIEWKEWLESAQNSYDYYLNAIGDSQEKFAADNNYKVK
jgi:hypothetical protein